MAEFRFNTHNYNENDINERNGYQFVKKGVPKDEILVEQLVLGHKQVSSIPYKTYDEAIEMCSRLADLSNLLRTDEAVDKNITSTEDLLKLNGINIPEDAHGVYNAYFKVSEFIHLPDADECNPCPYEISKISFIHKGVEYLFDPQEEYGMLAPDLGPALEFISKEMESYSPDLEY